MERLVSARTVGIPASLLSHEAAFAHTPKYSRSAYGQVSYQGGCAVAIRHDDGWYPDYNTCFGLLKARALTAGFAITQNFLTDIGGNVGSGNSRHISIANVQEMAANGMEIMSHSRTHAAITSDAMFLDEVVAVTNEMRAIGFFMDTYVQPGTWVAPYNMTSIAALQGANGLYGRAFKANFAALEAYVVEDGWWSQIGRPAPTLLNYGVQHETGDGKTLTLLKFIIDQACVYGSHLELLIHTNLLDTGGGNLTTADLTALYDYLQTLRDDGRITVLTPTGMTFSHSAAAPQNLLRDGGFEVYPLGASYPWQMINSPTIQASDAHTGTNCLRTNVTNEARQYLRAENLRTVRVTFWAKAQTGASALARAIVRFEDTTPTVYATADTGSLAVTGTWQKFQLHAGNHPSAKRMYLLLLAGNGTAADVLFDDVEVIAV